MFCRLKFYTLLHTRSRQLSLRLKLLPQSLLKLSPTSTPTLTPSYFDLPLLTFSCLGMMGCLPISRLQYAVSQKKLRGDTDLIFYTAKSRVPNRGFAKPISVSASCQTTRFGMKPYGEAPTSLCSRLQHMRELSEMRRYTDGLRQQPRKAHNQLEVCSGN